MPDRQRPQPPAENLRKPPANPQPFPAPRPGPAQRPQQPPQNIRRPGLARATSPIRDPPAPRPNPARPPLGYNRPPVQTPRPAPASALAKQNRDAAIDTHITLRIKELVELSPVVRNEYKTYPHSADMAANQASSTGQSYSSQHHNSKAAYSGYGGPEMAYHAERALPPPVSIARVNASINGTPQTVIRLRLQRVHDGTRGHEEEWIDLQSRHPNLTSCTHWRNCVAEQKCASPHPYENIDSISQPLKPIVDYNTGLEQ